ncbi:MAG: hypothetical protein AAF941_07870 [Pseudomonadota bacterium]
MSYPVSATPESRDQYLERLREVCEVDCLPQREFRRTARKRANSDESDMAVIMDVAFVRRVGSRFELHNMDIQRSPLVDFAILGSAGINTSSSNGVGGLPRGQRGGTHPDLIIIDMDEQTFSDILNSSTSVGERPVGSSDDGEIVVEGEQERQATKPTLEALRSLFRNRRVVVRGKPRLEAVFIGARRDFRRKQVTLELDNADDLVLLPRYDDDGNPILKNELAGLREAPASTDD